MKNSNNKMQTLMNSVSNDSGMSSTMKTTMGELINMLITNQINVPMELSTSTDTSTISYITPRLEVLISVDSTGKYSYFVENKQDGDSAKATNLASLQDIMPAITCIKTFKPKRGRIKKQND